MTRAPRVKGQTLSLKDSRETMSIKPTSNTEKRNAQLVVSAYVEAWHGDLSEREQIDIGVELIRLLGLQER